MRETTIEKKLVEKIKAAGGQAIKINSPGKAGMPDRMVLVAGGRIWFVETKAPGRKLRPLQEHIRLGLSAMGFSVRVIDTVEKIEALMEELKQ